LGGADTLIGGAGGDTLNGGAGDDTLNGNGGADVFSYVMGDGADTVNGGNGTDTLNITPAAPNANDTLDVIFNGTAITSVEGGSVSNVELVNASLNGGNDTLSYTGTTVAVSVNLSTGSATGFASISGIENATGGSGNDTLIGSAVSNDLSGGDGEDTLDGGTDNDTLTGGNGNDTYIANNGDTLIEAAAGGAADRVFTASGTFTLAANVENLTFTGVGNFIGTGNGSANVITANGGNDTLSGQGDDDTLNAGGGDDILEGGAGADRLVGGAGNDTMDGGNGNDVFVFAAGFGNDTIAAGFDANPAGGGQDLLEFSLSSFGFANAAAFNAAVSIVVGQFAGGAASALDTRVTLGLDTITLVSVDGAGNNVITSADFLLVA
jgi:Ca2+-binding RTX toxin-like protein